MDNFFALNHNAQQVSSKIINNPFNTDTTHKKFIEDYFTRSGKDSIINDFSIRIEDIRKANHTNSIFFLGILLFNNTEIKDTYFKDYNKIYDSKYHEFPFIWFLTCLFHDYGMGLEKDPKLINEIYDIEDLKKYFKITNCLLKNKPEGVHHKLFESIKKYFYFRRINGKRVDHGIAAGMYLYDRLVKNRKAKAKANNNEHSWHKDLDKQYALVSTAIASHNIWMPNLETVCDYYKFELKSLIDIKPISIKEFPLLYLLGVVDTLDPIKAYTDKFEDDYILKSLNINFSKDKMIIENGVNSDLDFSELHKKAENFTDWLDIEVIKEKNKLTVKIN